MYLTPPLMSPFSTMETIKEENSDMTEIATNEKFLKSAGFIPVSENEKGSEGALWAATEIFDMKLSIRESKLKESAKSSGLITITITDINIIYAIAAPDISSFNAFVSFRLSTSLSISSV